MATSTRKTTTKSGTKRTTRKTTTSRKSSTSKATAAPETPVEADMAEDSAAPEPPETAEAPAPAQPVKVLGKRELIDHVVAASGIKKKAAKPVIEALLKELGDALSRGETLNLQPFGRAYVKRSKDTPNAEVLELRLRRSKAAMAAAPDHAKPLEAETDDDGMGTTAAE